MATADTGAGGLDTRDEGRRTGLTPAQWYCLLAGAALLLAGILGFIADSTFDTGDDLQGDAFIGLEVNGWHNLVHVASGLVLLAAFARRAPAKVVALAFGLVYGVVTIIGLIDGNDILGLLPINAADNILHLALSVVGILAAIASPTDERRPDATDAGRRERRAADRDERFAREGEGARAGRDVDTLTGRPRDDRPTTRSD